MAAFFVNLAAGLTALLLVDDLKQKYEAIYAVHFGLLAILLIVPTYLEYGQSPGPGIRRPLQVLLYTALLLFGLLSVFSFAISEFINTAALQGIIIFSAVAVFFCAA